MLIHTSLKNLPCMTLSPLFTILVSSVNSDGVGSLVLMGVFAPDDVDTLAVIFLLRYLLTVRRENLCDSRIAVVGGNIVRPPTSPTRARYTPSVIELTLLIWVCSWLWLIC